MNETQTAPQSSVPLEPAPDSPEADLKSGQEHLRQGNLTTAAYAFHNALIGFEQANKDEGVANAANNLGDICVQRKDFAAAINHYERAFAICERLSDPSSLLYLRKKLAKSHHDLKQFDEAIKAYNTLLDIYLSRNNPEGAVETLLMLAEVYLDKGERPAAADSFRTAASIHASFKHTKQAEELLARAKDIEAS